LHAFPCRTGLARRHPGGRRAHRRVRQAAGAPHVVRAVAVEGAAALLPLFDIDGTLLSRATAAHSEALHDALHEVHGVDTRARRAGIDPAGRTDGEIARLLLLDAGVSAVAIDEGAGAVRAACIAAFARLCPPSLADTVIP